MDSLLFGALSMRRNLYAEVDDIIHHLKEKRAESGEPLQNRTYEKKDINWPTTLFPTFCDLCYVYLAMNSFVYNKVKSIPVCTQIISTFSGTSSHLQLVPQLHLTTYGKTTNPKFASSLNISKVIWQCCRLPAKIMFFRASAQIYILPTKINQSHGKREHPYRSTWL